MSKCDTCKNSSDCKSAEAFRFLEQMDSESTCSGYNYEEPKTMEDLQKEFMEKYYGTSAVGSKTLAEEYERGKCAGYAEGYEDGLMAKVTALEPHPTQAIVIGFNFDDIHVDDAYYLFDKINSNFPDNTVIAIPDYISLQSCSKDVLENMISMITEIIEKLENKTLEV